MDGWEGEPQTRAAGLTRAILDTFPIVKFGRGGNTPVAPAHDPQASVYTKTHVDSDIESGSILPRPKGGLEEYEMGSSVRNMNESREMGSVDTAVGGIARNASGSIGSRRSRPSKEDPTREMIGTEICPICISEFEEGDDLRVLPCEGKHKFHQNCVDPWLLQISGLCPLCREGTLVLGRSRPAANQDPCRLYCP